MNQDRLLALARRFADLAPAQRSVFLQRLADQNIDFSLLPIPPRAEAEEREIGAAFECDAGPLPFIIREAE